MKINDDEKWDAVSFYRQCVGVEKLYFVISMFFACALPFSLFSGTLIIPVTFWLSMFFSAKILINLMNKRKKKVKMSITPKINFK